MTILDIAKDFFCGCISGWAQVIVQQPFELVKARLVNQSISNPEYHGIVDCFSRVLKEEGFLGYYKGSLAPMLGVGAHVSLQFGFNELLKRVLMKFQDEENQNQLPTMPLVILSGSLTGIPSALALTPIDHLKIQMQMQKGPNARYHGSIDAGAQIYRKYGIRGLYLGFNITLLRQVVALSQYFGLYQYCMRVFSQYGEDTPQKLMMTSFISGGLAGSCSWLFSYPIDYIKTLIQSQHLEEIRFSSMMDCVRQKYLEEGYKTFFKGLGVAMLRSFPVNGVGFFVFEWMMKVTGRKRNFNEFQEELQ